MLQTNMTDLSKVGRDPTLFKDSALKMVEDDLLKLGGFLLPPWASGTRIQNVEYPNVFG